MPLKDPIKRAEAHARYMREVWYPAHKENHLKLVNNRKQIYRTEIKAWLNELKKECLLCKETAKCCLSFHHVTGKKEFNLSEIVTRMPSRKRIEQEVAKCVVLCENCHRKVHSGGVDLVLRLAHNQESAGSNPVSAPKIERDRED